MAASMNSTTLSAALGKFDQAFKVAAATYTLKDSILFCEGEAMLVMQAPIGTFLPKVFRGYAGSTAQAHTSGAIVWAGTPDAYYDSEPYGAAVAANELWLPRIVLQTRSLFTLVNGFWTRLWDRGVPISLPGGAVQSYTISGAINLQGGTHQLTGALTMTLAAPDGNTPEGTVLTIVQADAAGSTVTQAGNIGFLNTTTSSDVMTFAATAGGAATIQNIGGAWRLIANSGIANTSSVTFG